MNETSSLVRTPARSREEAPTAKGRNTTARILEAGRAVLEERGYFEASVTAITERSGIALGTFYRYFDNKDVLFLQLLETLVTDLFESVSGSWGKDDEMENLHNSSLRYLTAYYANRKLIASLIQMASAVPACAVLWWDLRKRTYDQMKRYLTASKIGRDLDPELTAIALGSMVEQFAYYWYVEAERNGKPVPELEAAADVLSRIWYRAVYQRNPVKTRKRKQWR